MNELKEINRVLRNLESRVKGSEIWITRIEEIKEKFLNISGYRLSTEDRNNLWLANKYR
jgi:hypothetical protein